MILKEATRAIKLSWLVLFFLVGGCATGHFTKAKGDVGQFILQQAIRLGGVPTATNGLQVVTAKWRYAEDRHGLQIILPFTTYDQVEGFLNVAFSGAKQFGPNGSAMEQNRLHIYRMSSHGGG